MTAAPDIAPRDLAELAPRDLADKLARGEPLALLDVREPTERSFCAIRVAAGVGDLHVPVGQVASELETIREAAAGRPLVVYCHHGVRSRMVVDWLTHQGVPGLLNLAGGIHAWSVEVDPQVPRY
jgi:rhodanese-related sulfurtransferase